MRLHMSSQNHFDVIVIGGGIVGLATAYKLTQRFPSKKILVLEKEKEVAAHQTGHNSGVIHSGIYYKPGSYKAKNCVAGRRELVQFAKEHNIQHDICGKIIVATHESELAHMSKVFNNGVANGVEGIEMIDAKRIKEIEPYCEGIAGIWVPCTGIIDYTDVAKKYVELINKHASGSKVITGCEATGFINHPDKIEVTSPQGNYTGSYVITCGGLQADRLAKKQGKKSDAAIVGFRGDYYDLTDKGMKKVKNLIYPVPNPKFPFLGVHFTRMIKHGVECGPNAVFVFKREGYSKTAFSLRDTLSAFSFSGTWKFFKKHWRFGLDEYRGAFSKTYFLNRLRKLIPSLEADDIITARCGIRAMALAPEGEMIDDFKIEYGHRAAHVINSPSPAATASLAYGNEIVTMVSSRFNGLN
ncbi:MAG TPA: L-2-hydroxyglutarate oxidase [Bacteroidia bacterium]|nr:L-2-hydroxyglutarate oxidase [Bacteroidia bacterium]